MGRPDGRRPLPTCEIGRPVPGVDGGRTPGHAWHPVVPCVTLRRNIAGFTAVALRTARWSSPGPVAVDGSTGLPACLGAGLPLIRHCDELVGVGPPGGMRHRRRVLHRRSWRCRGPGVAGAAVILFRCTRSAESSRAARRWMRWVRAAGAITGTGVRVVGDFTNQSVPNSIGTTCSTPGSGTGSVARLVGPDGEVSSGVRTWARRGVAAARELSVGCIRNVDRPVGPPVRSPWSSGCGVTALPSLGSCAQPISSRDD